MNRKLKVFLIFIVVVIALMFIGRFTGVYQFYELPTSSMEPTLTVGKRIIATNLKKPKRNNIILFTRWINEKFEDDPNGKKNVFCSRLIAMGGDTLEIKNGFAYVNNVLADDTIQLKLSYVLPGKDLNKLKPALEIDIENDKSGDFQMMGDSAYAFLSGKQYEQVKNVIQLKKRMNSISTNTPIHSKDWTIDNFGPYIIPPDHFFVMGDNRHKAMDSRFIGPIPAKNYEGTLMRF